MVHIHADKGTSRTRHSHENRLLSAVYMLCLHNMVDGRRDVPSAFTAAESSNRLCFYGSGSLRSLRVLVHLLKIHKASRGIAWRDAEKPTKTRRFSISNIQSFMWRFNTFLLIGPVFRMTWKLFAPPPADPSAASTSFHLVVLLGSVWWKQNNRRFSRLNWFVRSFNNLFNLIWMFLLFRTFLGFVYRETNAQ